MIAGWLLIAQLVPIAGIPAPSCGLAEMPGPPTVYVNEATGNDANAGSQEKPRRTIPRVLTAGMVVSVQGLHATSYSSPQTLECRGTPDKPAFILGGNFQRGGELTGTNCILDGGSGPGGWALNAKRPSGDSSCLTVRHYVSTGGFSVYPNWPGTVSDVVFSDVSVDLGYVDGQTESGGDWHCIAIGKSARVWVLNSKLRNCRGDGTQVNGGSGGNLDTGPVYIGGNVFEHNRQSGVGIKQSHDVTISTNTITKMRPDADFTNPGACLVAQYWPVRLALIGNDCSDSENGVIIAGYDSEAMTPATASGVGMFSNRITNIHATKSQFDPQNPRSPGNGIILVGASRRYLQDNVIDGADGGISLAYGTYEGSGNVQTNIGSPAKPELPLCASIPNLLTRLVAYLRGQCR